MYCQSIVSTLGLFFHVNFVKKITVGNKFIFLWDYSKCISIFKYSIYTWLSSLGGVLFGQVDRLLVGSVMGSESLGIYSAITSMTVQINSLSALPVQPILPKLSQFYCKSANSTIDARLMIKSALKINCMVAFGMGVIFLTFDSLILSTFLDAHSVLENTKNFQLATIIYTFYAVNAVGYYVCFGINAVNICMTVQILSGILSICLISLGLTYFGLTGGIVGNIGYWLVFLLTLLGFRKLNLNLSEWILWIVIPITIFVSSCMSTFLLKDYGLLKIAVGVVQLTCLIAWFFNSKSLIMSNSDSID
jgi:O-antigen/teichoic acid export membrane protein